MPHLELVTATTGAPITTADAKAHLNIADDASHDTYISDTLVPTAVDYCERNISGGRQFMEATYDYVLPGFPDRIELPKPPLKSVTSITYITSTGGSATVDTTNYSTQVPQHTPGFIDPVFAFEWPTARDQADAVTVRFVAGYDTPALVPPSIKHAIRLLVGHWFENREAVVTGVIPNEMKIAVNSLLNGNEYGHYS